MFAPRPNVILTAASERLAALRPPGVRHPVTAAARDNTDHTAPFPLTEPHRRAWHRIRRILRAVDVYRGSRRFKDDMAHGQWRGTNLDRALPRLRAVLDAHWTEMAPVIPPKACVALAECSGDGQCLLRRNQRPKWLRNCLTWHLLRNCVGAEPELYGGWRTPGGCRSRGNPPLGPQTPRSRGSHPVKRSATLITYHSQRSYGASMHRSCYSFINLVIYYFMVDSMSVGLVLWGFIFGENLVRRKRQDAAGGK